jgi:hypothetical protein
LRIYFIGNGHDVRQQPAEYHSTLISVQRRKNADLEDSGFVHDHRRGVALLASKLSVAARGCRNRGFGSFVETQPGNYVMEKFRKMAGAFFEIQRDAN